MADSTAHLGFWKNLRLLDVPFSITSISGDALKNLQVTSLNEVAKYVPSMQIEARGGFELGRPQTRGFEGSVVETTRLDGLNIVSTTSYPMEQFQNLEILNGIAGSLYGPAAPSGSFNYTNKRVLNIPLSEVGLSYQQQGLAGVYADFSRNYSDGDNSLGFRVNSLYADGEGYTDNSNLTRWFIGTAFDAKMGNLKLETNFGHYRYTLLGYPGGFGYSATTVLPKALDPTKAGYGQEWTGPDLRTITANARAIYTINSNWSVTAGILNQIVDRGQNNVSNTVLANEEQYRQTATLASTPGRFKVLSNLLNVTGIVKTGTVKHNIVFGANGFVWSNYATTSSASAVLLDTSYFEKPTVVSQPQALANPAARYKSSSTIQQTENLGDNINLTKHFATLLSISYSKITTKAFDKTGAQTSSTSNDGFNYSASVIYKPVDMMSIYATYSDVMQAGSTYTNSTTNVTTILDPIRCTQYELGYKVSLGQANFSLAAFRIKRPFAFTDPDDGVYKYAGDQVNTGLELNTDATVSSFHFIAGITLLDPKLEHTVSETTSDKQVVGVPKTQGNVFVEYRLPMRSDFSLNANAHITSRKPENTTNSAWVDGYTTFDLGARYTMAFMGKKVVWNLQASNLFNKYYWSSIFPASINGETTTSYSAFLGAPRELKASVRVMF